MPFLERKRRQYTQEGGWGRNPTAFESARDLVVDVAASIGRAVGAVVLKPHLTTEQRRAHTREERYKGNWSYVAPEKTPLLQRVRVGRVATFAVAAGVAVAKLTFMDGGEVPAKAPDSGNVFIAPGPTQVGEQPQPILTEEQKQRLTAAYEAVKGLWAQRGIDPTKPSLVLLSGQGSSYTCPSGNGHYTTPIKPNNSSMYCPQTDTLVITAGGVNNWTPFKGPVGAEYSVIGHEYGHHIQDVQGDRPPERQAKERGAECHAGYITGVFAPGEVERVRQAILNNAAHDSAHGAPPLLAAAYALGAAGGNCHSSNFLTVGS